MAAARSTVVNVCFTSGGTYIHLSRTALLFWINNTLETSLSKIEDLCTGAAYCQLMDILFPNCINLQRVKFESALEYEFIQNYKLVQGAFQKLGITHIVPIEKLVKGRFQDNLEFLQWFKRFFDANYTEKEYDALVVRKGCRIGFGSSFKPQFARSRTCSVQPPSTRTSYRSRIGKNALRRVSSQRNVTSETEARCIQQIPINPPNHEPNLKVKKAGKPAPPTRVRPGRKNTPQTEGSCIQEVPNDPPKHEFNLKVNKAGKPAPPPRVRPGRNVTPQTEGSCIQEVPIDPPNHEPNLKVNKAGKPAPPPPPRVRPGRKVTPQTEGSCIQEVPIDPSNHELNLDIKKEGKPAPPPRVRPGINVTPQTEASCIQEVPIDPSIHEPDLD